MLIQIYIKNEPLAPCHLLIAKEDAGITVPAADLASLLERDDITVALVKPSENMAMKAAIETAKAIRESKFSDGPVQVQCPDKAILDGICSMEYTGPDGSPVKCVPAGTKPAQGQKSKTKDSGKKPAGQNPPKPGPVARGAQDASANGGPGGLKQEGTSTDDGGASGGPEGLVQDGAGSNGGESFGDLMKDPEFVSGNEVAVKDEKPAEKPRDPVAENTPRIMGILKETGVPSGQIPGVLEALREAMDAGITLPMQVKLKLAKDGATGDMDPEETAKRVAPRFDELKALLKEIDDANAAKS